MTKVLRFTPYTAAEQALLDLYFKRTAHDPEPTEPLGVLLYELAGDAVSGDCGERVLDVAAAKLILRNHEDCLPNWGYVGADGQVHVSREMPPPPKKGYRLHSQVLLQIDWGASGPGFSWPEEYRITWLPSPGRFVVTASTDSDELHGYTDVALGHFAPPSGDVLEKVRLILVRRWKIQKRAHEQMPWETILDEGLAGKERAELWRLAAWGRRAIEGGNGW